MTKGINDYVSKLKTNVASSLNSSSNRPSPSTQSGTAISYSNWLTAFTDKLKIFHNEITKKANETIAFAQKESNLDGKKVAEAVTPLVKQGIAEFMNKYKS